MPARLADFIREDETKLVALILHVSLALTTILIPIPVYLIVKVKTIGKYRWYMLNGLTWDYVYDATLTLLKPVLFFPFLGGYVSVCRKMQSFLVAYSRFEGPLPVIGNPRDFALFCMIVFLVLVINLIGSAVMSLAYRFAQVS